MYTGPLEETPRIYPLPIEEPKKKPAKSKDEEPPPPPQIGEFVPGPLGPSGRPPYPPLDTNLELEVRLRREEDREGSAAGGSKGSRPGTL